MKQPSKVQRERAESVARFAALASVGRASEKLRSALRPRERCQRCRLLRAFGEDGGRTIFGAAGALLIESGLDASAAWLRALELDDRPPVSIEAVALRRTGGARFGAISDLGEFNGFWGAVRLNILRAHVEDPWLIPVREGGA